jgi:hypothetical protein
VERPEQPSTRSQYGSHRRIDKRGPCEHEVIKLKPETSVLKLKVGDSIALSEAGFSLLSKAFFDEIERKFVS